jgi:hypothetical protein
MGKDRMTEALGAATPSGAATAKTGKTARDESMKTLYLSPEIVAWLRRYAEEWGVSESEAARYIIERGLDVVAKKPPKMQTVTKAVL